MNKFLDARGMACPLPVVNTRRAIEELSGGGSVEVLVDNEIAVQNLAKFARVRGYGINSEKIAQDHYRVVICTGAQAEVPAEAPAQDVCSPAAKNNAVVVLASDCMGGGDDTLGRALMKSYLFALTRQDSLPSAVVMYNGGAHLSCAGSEVLEDLKLLEAEGVEIITCGTCLDYYGLKDRLCVGSVSNMYEIAEVMNNAGKIIRP